jgi:hypothetical protein
MRSLGTAAVWDRFRNGIISEVGFNATTPHAPRPMRYAPERLCHVALTVVNCCHEFEIHEEIQ